MERLYSKEHLWFEEDCDHIFSIGFTSYLLLQGTPEVLSLPCIGQSFAAYEQIGSLETTKCTIDIILPFAAQVIAVNQILTQDAKNLSLKAEGSDWLCKVKKSDATEKINLLSKKQYLLFSNP